MQLRRTLVAGAATVALAAAAALLPHANEATAGTPRGTGRAAEPRVVTLITGDRLTVFGPDKIGIERGKGREHVTFVTRTMKGHTQLIPVDALPLLRAGRLDSRLFDVTSLLEYGYDRRTDLPLILTAPATAGKKAVAPAVPAGARVVRALPGIRGVAARAARKGLGALWRGIKARGAAKDAPTIWLDGVRHVTLDVSVPHIGAPAAWQAGYNGAGVTVAVVDSGVDAEHPDLAGRVVAQHTFVEGEDDLDHVGHGTHVASTIAGTGAASGGRNSGVAPAAKLVVAKVCGEFGCPDSAIIAGMQWAVAEQHAKVVNMSLGGGDSPEVDPLEQAVQDLTAQYGALFVIAAGNAGADETIGSPGSADAALTVGAVDDDDALALFSSRGPRTGDAALKPDITAPGVDIVAARSKDTTRGTPGDQYLSLSGTSMATPHVAGTAAILAQRRPDWGPQELKAALMASALPNAKTGIFAQGAGRVDVPRAIAQTLTTSPASLSFGRPVWPHSDDAPVAKTVTYRNLGAAAVTLNLALETTGPDLAPTPDGMFQLSASTLTVPAGGTADVVVTADTRVAGKDGFAGGYVVATAGDSVTRTPLAVDKEAESYDLNLSYVDRAGQPTEQFITRLINLDTSESYTYFFDSSAATKARLPKGRYLVHTTVLDGDLEGETVESDLVQPVLDLSRARTLTIDARTAKPVSVNMPRAGATQIHAEIYYGARVPDGVYVWGEILPTFGSLYLGRIGGSSYDGLTVKLGGQWAQGRPDGTVDDSPYTYNLAWVARGKGMNGFHREVHNADLAAVHARYLSHIPGATGSKYAISHVAKDIEFGASPPTSFRTPFSRTEYFSDGTDLRWNPRFSEQAPEAEEPAYTAAALGLSYRAGHRYAETWNQAVFGPAFPGGYDATRSAWVGRVGDEIQAVVPMFGDGAGRAGGTTGVDRVTLYRDGVQIGVVDRTDGAAIFPVPAERGRYRLEVSAERAAPFTLSTKVTGAWEFESGHGDRAVIPLPLAAVRFSPRLDANHAAPAGRQFAVPVSVQAQAGSGEAENRSLSVDVSFDDGATWKPVRLRSQDGKTTAVVPHPQGAGFVSLRAKATDADGNTVEQTIIRAYRVV